MGLAQPGAVVFQAPVLAGSGSRLRRDATPAPGVAQSGHCGWFGWSNGCVATGDDVALRVRRPVPELGRDMVADAGLCCGPRKTNGWVQ